MSNTAIDMYKKAIVAVLHAWSSITLKGIDSKSKKNNQLHVDLRALINI